MGGMIPCTIGKMAGGKYEFFDLGQYCRGFERA